MGRSDAYSVCGGSREALSSPGGMESIKLRWQLHGAYVVLDGIFLSQATFLVDSIKSIPQSWGRVQTAGFNSQLKISLEAGKPQEIFFKKKRSHKRNCLCEKKFRVQGAKIGGAGQSDNNSKTTGKNSPRCSLVMHSLKEGKQEA